MDLSVFTKDLGILTKDIRLIDGEIIKDGSQCRMANGSVQTISIKDLLAFKELLDSLNQSQAIALGTSDECDKLQSVRVVKKGLEKAGQISRSKAFFTFKQKPALIVFDYDPQPHSPALSLDNIHKQLLELMPELVNCEILALGSTSAGLYKSEDKPPETFTGGCHLYCSVDDASKIPLIGKLLEDRSWLHGYGRFDISKSGSLLSRSLFDSSVYSPERLIFEAKPILDAGVKQLPRAFQHWSGGVLETANINAINIEMATTIEALKLTAKTIRQPEADLTRDNYSQQAVTRLVTSGISKSTAIAQVTNAQNGILTGAHLIQFANYPLVTVTDILRNPDRFHLCDCLDPDETGDSSAHYRAKGFDNENQFLISSFRHGRINYKLDKVSIKLDTHNAERTFKLIEQILSIGVYPDIFDFKGALVFIGSDGNIRPLTAITAPISIGRFIQFTRTKELKKEWVESKALFPDRLCKAWLEQGSWKIPQLQGILHNPYFYNDQIVHSRGFNHVSGLFLTRDFDGFSSIKNSSYEAAKDAILNLRNLLSGFPFLTAVDESVAIAMMLTAIQRPTLETAPLFGISATAPGTGKTQLACGVASIASGDKPAVHGFKDNETETAKMLMSALLIASPHIIIDNVKLGVALGGDALCAILSSANYSDRELGFSRIRQVSTASLFIATGNNLKLDSDITRRSLIINLDARCEQPELRKFDKNFLQTCSEQRQAILSSLLTILEAYHAAGSPKINNIRLGTFEQWCDELAAPLVWLGLVDPALGQAKATADDGVAGLGELLHLWKAEIKFSSRTARELMNSAVTGQWFRSEFDDRGGVTERKIGRILSKFSGRIVDGMRIIKTGTLHRAVVWQLECVSG